MGFGCPGSCTIPTAAVPIRNRDGAISCGSGIMLMRFQAGARWSLSCEPSERRLRVIRPMPQIASLCTNRMPSPAAWPIDRSTFWLICRTRTAVGAVDENVCSYYAFDWRIGQGGAWHRNYGYRKVRSASRLRLPNRKEAEVDRKSPDLSGRIRAARQRERMVRSGALRLARQAVLEMVYNSCA